MVFRLTAVLLFALYYAATASADCFDIGRQEPSKLEGEVRHYIFAGPPNFEDVEKGDMAEPSFVLHLARPICITGDEFSDPKVEFQEVQLVTDAEMENRLARLEGQNVVIRVERPMAAHTGHHHRPLLAWVKEVEASVPAIPNKNARDAVEGFYRALEKGDGGQASGFVVPEKNRRGPLSPKALGDFYGTLTEKLTLQTIVREKADRFSVRYRYKADNKVCNGNSIVSTEKRGGQYLIRSIKSPSGC